MIITGLVSGFIFMAILGGPWKTTTHHLRIGVRRERGLLVLLGVTGWFAHPSVGLIGIIITGVGAAVGVTAISTGLANRRALYASLIVVAIWAAAWYPLQYLFFYLPTGWMLWILFDRRHRASASASACSWAATARRRSRAPRRS